jgi:transcriptional regulator with XRE-family HTH domain
MGKKRVRKNQVDVVPGRIRKFREQARYSVNAAARFAGMSQAEWFRFEAGERLPTLRRLWMIADVLGRQPGEFIDEK